MAGEGKLFKKMGFMFPKPLIEIKGRPMIEFVVNNLKSVDKKIRYIFIVNKKDCLSYHIDDVLRLLINDPVIILSEETAGAACSALLAIDYINTEDPLLIANGDQYINTDVGKILSGFRKKHLDGGIVVFNSVHPRWSFVRTDSLGYVLEAAEKKPISRNATVGLYYFKRGIDFVESVMSMIKKENSMNGEYYICPSYNEMILKNKKIKIASVKNEDFFPLGTPEDIKEFEKKFPKTLKIK